MRRCAHSIIQDDSAVSRHAQPFQALGYPDNTKVANADVKRRCDDACVKSLAAALHPKKSGGLAHCRASTSNLAMQDACESLEAGYQHVSDRLCRTSRLELEVPAIAPSLSWLISPHQEHKFKNSIASNILSSKHLADS